MIREDAPAKLNLYLHVLGRRADGYHLLDSLVAFASVGDVVTVRPAAGLSLQVDGPFAAAVPADEDNLACRAARRLAEALGRPPDVAIGLTKALPVAAGIGGGSADAAAVLRALARLWGVPEARAEARAEDRGALLQELAGTLGADVPVCLAGRTQFMAGIGERLDPAPVLSGVPVLLVNPGIAVPTPAVFRARQGDFSAPGRFAGPPAGPAALARLLADRRNDLAEPACRLFPEIAAVLAALRATPGCLLARMSGSGATCFALYATAGEAEAAAGLLPPAWWRRPGRLL